MTLESRQSKYILIILIIFLILLTPKIANALISADLVNRSGVSADYLRYDRKNQTLGNNTYGSNSYMDHNPTNPNLYLEICHPDLTKGDMVDIVHTGLNRSYYSSILNFFPQVTSTTNHSDANGTYNCSTIDVDLSSIHAIYPGYIHPVIIPQGVSYSHDNYNMAQSFFLPRLNQTLNGSYDVGISITGIIKIYHISVEDIFDDQGQDILGVVEPYLIVSLVNSSNDILLEEKLAPQEEALYSGDFRGGERIYVNEIDSLAISTYQPCGIINESGYYLFNESATDLNDTCIIINNSEDILLNFGGELIDGDADPNGSFRQDICAVIIENSDEVVLEYARLQEFYYGICIKNSNVSIYGNYSAYNIHGSKIYNESTVNFYSFYFSNTNSEVISVSNSQTNLTNVSFINATRIRSSLEDIMMRTVIQVPSPPNITNISDIDQYIELNNLSSNARATIGFYYTIPIANNVSLSNISIYQYNADRDPNSSTGWEDANWTALYTVIDTNLQLIRTDSVDEYITNFSVFAPFGFINKSFISEPEPEPEPEPSPSPSAGESGSRGAQPREVQLKLEIPNNITLMQGEAGEIKFNVSNVGTIFAPYVSVGPMVPEDWLYTNLTIGDMLVGDNASGEFQIAPHERTTPMEYEITVNAYIKREGEVSVVTSKILKVIVIPRTEELARIKFLEYPPVIATNPSSVINISFLSKNIGGVFLENITIEIDDSPCINNIRGAHDLDVDETRSLKYLFNFTSEENECDVNIKFYSKKKLVGFVSSKILLRHEFRPEVTRRTYIILLYLIWTIITAYVIGRRRKSKKEKKKNETKPIE